MPFKSLFASTVLLLVGNIFCSPVFEQDSFADSKYFEALDVGRQLKPVQVSSLERHLADDPKDLEKRTKLIGYYFYQSEDRLARRKRGEHVLWFIKNAPEAAVLGWWQVGLDYRMNADLFGQAEDAWSWHLENDPDNLEVLWNASKFYMDTNWERSTALLEHAQSLDKTNPSWAEELGLLHLMNSLDLVGERDPEAASRALFHYERAYAVSDELRRDSQAPVLAMIAFYAGQYGTARQYAESMLGGHLQGWNEGNRIHFGNLTLGRIAFLEGDIEEAKARLIAAGEIPGSPALCSFGPDMTLAKELLERGESEVVLRFLSLSSEFWEGKQETLQAWTARVEEGGMPDFGSNLNFWSRP